MPPCPSSPVVSFVTPTVWALVVACGPNVERRAYVIIVEDAFVEESCVGDDFDCSDPDNHDTAVLVVRNLTGEDWMSDPKEDCEPAWGTAAFDGDAIPGDEMVDFGVRIEVGEEFLFGSGFEAYETFRYEPSRADIEQESLELSDDCAGVTISVVED